MAKDKRQGFVVDLGNSGLKSMLEARPDSKCLTTHAVRIMSEQELKDHSEREKLGAIRGASASKFTLLLKDDNGAAYEKSFVIGSAAERGAFEKRAGGAKYIREYYSALLVSQLLQHYPNGHDNLNLMAMHPPSDFRFKDLLIDSLGGVHKARLMNGENVKWVVRDVSCQDEPVNGLCNFIMANDGISFKADSPIRSKDTILTIDIGGKISSMSVASIRDGVDYSQTFSEDIGIQDVLNSLSTLILTMPEHQKHFAEYKGSLPHNEKMRDALITGQLEFNGYELDVLKAVADATAEIRSRLKAIYKDKFNRAGMFNHIVITGGGGALLFNQLTEHVLDFNPQKIHYAHDNKDEMHFANLFGADKVLAGIIGGEYA